MKFASRLMLMSLILGLSSVAYAQETDIRIYRNGDTDDEMGGMEDLADLGSMFAEMPDLDMFMPGGPMMGMDNDVEAGMPMPPGMPQELNLTKEQKDKLKKIRSDAKKAGIPLKGNLELKRIELKELMDADSPNKDQVAAKIKEVESIKSQLAIIRANARIDGRSILTKEQRDKLEDMRGQHRMMMFRHGGDGPEGDGPGGERKMIRKFKDKEKE